MYLQLLFIILEWNCSFLRKVETATIISRGNAITEVINMFLFLSFKLS